MMLYDFKSQVTKNAIHFFQVILVCIHLEPSHQAVKKYKQGVECGSQGEERRPLAPGRG